MKVIVYFWGIFIEIRENLYFFSDMRAPFNMLDRLRKVYNMFAAYDE